MNLPKTIKDTQDKLSKKEFSLVELIDAYLERINKYDKDLNSFITVTDEKAYDEAKNIPIEKGFPLYGVVVAHKDLFSTEGIRTTAGSKVLEGYIPEYSATVVKRLEEAGAIVIGKANCDAWAHGASGENSDFGATKNPWNKNFVPGGSSSGSAVAVASDFSLISTGTDTGGSIRQPASFCNVVGFKPTYGAVSRYGVIAMASSLDSVGHFTHSVADSKKVFEVVKGIDNLDSTVSAAKFLLPKTKMKLGVPKEYFEKGLSNDVENVVKSAIEIYKKLGIEIVEVSLPHTKYAIDVYYIIQPAEVSSNLGRYDGIRFGNGRDSFAAEAKRRIMLGTYVLSAGYYDAYYLKAMKVRTKIIEDFEKVFEKVDALIAPVSPTPPFKIGEKSEDPIEMYLADILTAAANVAGIPGLSLPGGFSSAGLPIGFQLLGPRWGENVLFSLGELFQSETDYHFKSPKL